MSGSISLSLSQQFDRNGKPLSGGRLWTYQANTTTPQNVFKDPGLTLPHPNPITLDSNGRIPAFYMADGFIRVRLTDKSGVVQIDEPQLLVIGPSSGSGGGGPSVDPNAIFQTGWSLWLPIQGTIPGWVRANARTIGNATSGATERANADCQSLFTYLWTNFSDTFCPVPGGRGASAAADWAANKQITLLDMRGRAPFGVDDMGNTAALRLTGNGKFDAGSNSFTPGGTGGEDSHQLTVGELAGHKHPAFIHDPTHVHTISSIATTGGSRGSTAGNDLGGSGSTNAAATGVRVQDAASNLDTTDSAGGGQRHNNLPPFMLGSFYLKL